MAGAMDAANDPRAAVGIDSGRAADAAALASELRLAVHRLTRRLRAQRPRDGLTLTQLSTLVSVWREGPMTAGEVAAREGVKPPSATRIISGLGSLGLISREPDPTDGRQVRVAITEQGRGRVEADLQARDVWLARHLAEWDVAEHDLLRRAIVMLDELSSQ